jgi:hypothetical protein
VMGDVKKDGASGRAQARTMSYSNGLEYFGAVLQAAMKNGGSGKLSEAELRKMADDEIIKSNQGLVDIGESVVNTYLSASPAPSVSRP